MKPTLRVLTKGDKRYTALSSDVSGIEGTVVPLLHNNCVDIEELFEAMKEANKDQPIDYVSLEQISNLIGITTFNIRIGTINKVLQHYMFICKEEV